MNLPFSTLPLPDPSQDAEWLSALADGESSGHIQGPQQACEQWAKSPALRERWHTYHLIGDVMRSEELATAPDSDAAFMIALRARLDREPVVMAPMPALVPATSARRVGWRMPAAVAAGFVVVAGVWTVARLGQPGADPAGSAAVMASKAAPALTLAAGSDNRDAGQTVIRDARLDDYLRAHQSARGGAAAVPGGGLRNVDVSVPGGAPR